MQLIPQSLSFGTSIHHKPAASQVSCRTPPPMTITLASSWAGVPQPMLQGPPKSMLSFILCATASATGQTTVSHTFLAVGWQSNVCRSKVVHLCSFVTLPTNAIITVKTLIYGYIGKNRIVLDATQSAFHPSRLMSALPRCGRAGAPCLQVFSGSAYGKASLPPTRTPTPCSGKASALTSSPPATFASGASAIYTSMPSTLPRWLLPP